MRKFLAISLLLLPMVSMAKERSYTMPRSSDIKELKAFVDREGQVHHRGMQMSLSQFIGELEYYTQRYSEVSLTLDASQQTPQDVILDIVDRCTSLSLSKFRIFYKNRFEFNS